MELELADNWTINGSSEVQDSVRVYGPEYAVTSVMIALFALVGIVGNVPILIVYSRRKEKKASNTFIKILAVLDLLVCTSVMPYSVMYEYHLVTSDIACRLFESLRHFAVMSSNVTLVAIALERYIAVCRIDVKLNVSKLNKGIGAIFAFGAITASPAAGIFSVVRPDEVENVPCLFPHELASGHFCHFTYTILGFNFVTAYQLGQMLIFFGVLLIIVTLYTIVYFVLMRKTKKRKQLTLTPRPSVAPPSSHQPQEKNRAKLKLSDVTLLTEADSNANRVSLVDSVPRKRIADCESLSTDDKPNEQKIQDDTQPNEQKNQDDTQPNEQKNQDDKQPNEQKNQDDKKPNEQKNQDDTPPAERPPLKKRSTVANFIINKRFSIASKVRFENSSFGRNSKASATTKTQTTSSTVPKDKGTHRRSYCHRRTAKMLFMCTVIYFISWIPFWFDIFGLTNSLILRYLFFLGNATNPLVYGIVNKRVRDSVWKLFGNCMTACCKKSSSVPPYTGNGSRSGTSSISP